MINPKLGLGTFCVMIFAFIFSFRPSQSQANATPTPFQAISHYEKILNIPTLDSIHSPSSAHVNWSPDRENLAVTYDYSGTIRIVSSDTGALRFTLETPAQAAGYSVGYSQWSPNGKSFAAAVDRPVQNILIWDLSGSSVKAPLIISQTGEQPTFSWIRDGKELLSTGFMAQPSNAWWLFRWNVTDGRLVKKIRTDNARKIFVSYDGRKIATLTRAQEVHSPYLLQIRDVETFEIQRIFPDENDSFDLQSVVSWNTDNNQLAGASCNSISGTCYLWLWNTQDNQLRKPFKAVKHQSDGGNTGPFTILALNPKHNLLAVNDRSEPNYVWNTETGELISGLDGNASWVSSVSWSPDGSMLATGTDDGSVIIWKDTSS
ncbi:MAG: hypothetical protein ABI947_29090 [Chloroflexota bacterium]